MVTFSLGFSWPGNEAPQIGSYTCTCIAQLLLALSKQRKLAVDELSEQLKLTSCSGPLVSSATRAISIGCTVEPL